ncbi:hypothetical protein DFH27DRAFT_640198 [Peziza echinospora]|nr:hypothetical protein DFH27DRAFT_640198 [Peziza echinospora]
MICRVIAAYDMAFLRLMRLSREQSLMIDVISGIELCQYRHPCTRQAIPQLDFRISTTGAPMSAYHGRTKHTNWCPRSMPRSRQNRTIVIRPGEWVGRWIVHRSVIGRAEGQPCACRRRHVQGGEDLCALQPHRPQPPASSRKKHSHSCFEGPARAGEEGDQRPRGDQRGTKRHGIALAVDSRGALKEGNSSPFLELSSSLTPSPPYPTLAKKHSIHHTDFAISSD